MISFVNKKNILYFFCLMCIVFMLFISGKIDSSFIYCNVVLVFVYIFNELS